MMLIEVAISLFVVWFLWYMLTTYKRRKQMPPGPFPLPFVGNLHQMDHDPLISFEKFQEQYGDVFTVSLPNGITVAINSADAAQEALLTRKEDMVGRTPSSLYPLNLVFEEKDLLTSNYGSVHIFRRKVFKSGLRSFSATVESSEKGISPAVQSLFDEIDALEGHPFSPKMFVASAIASELWRWLSGEKCSFVHPTVMKLLEFNKKWPVLYAPGSLYHLVPLMRYFPTAFHETFDRVLNIREEIFTPLFESHRDTYQSGVIRDLTDSFLSAYEKEITKETGKEIGSIEDVKGLMMNVIAGGGDTTSSFVAWFILAMILNPDVETKIQAELDDVIGRERLPRWEDADALPYLQATICEVMRLATIVPFVSHSASRDSTLRGYKVPRGTTVVFNIATIQRDPRQWPEPRSFKPERFLYPDGKFVGWTKFPGFIPFNIGRRSCPGMLIGKIESFSFVSALLHHFRFELPKGHEAPRFEYEAFGSIVSPKDYKIIAKKRM